MDEKVLKHLHDEMLVIYKEIARICDKYNLTYFTVGGTLLGAVIHKGYIPWDDDLDIAMPRDDYDKFVEVYSKELDSRFFLHHTSTDDDYWLSFAKVRMNNTVFLEEKRKNVKAHSGIYVDIFPFDYSGKCNTFSQKLKWRWMTYLNNYIYSKVTGKGATSGAAKLLNILFSPFSIKKLSLHRDRIMRSFDKGERKFYVDLAGGRRLDNSYFKIESMLPVHDMSFGETTVKAPKDYDGYLLQLYTEKYKVIPPKDKQITHEPLLIRFVDGSEYKADKSDIV